MKYIFNDDKDIKVRDEKGNEKFLPKHLVEDDSLMKRNGLKIVEAPVIFDPKKTEK